MMRLGLRVWDLQQDRGLQAVKGHTDKVKAIVVTSDGQRAVSA